MKFKVGDKCRFVGMGHDMDVLITGISDERYVLTIQKVRSSGHLYEGSSGIHADKSNEEDMTRINTGHAKLENFTFTSKNGVAMTSTIKKI